MIDSGGGGASGRAATPIEEEEAGEVAAVGSSGRGCGRGARIGGGQRGGPTCSMAQSMGGTDVVWVSGFKYRIFLGDGFLRYGHVSSWQPKYFFLLQSCF